MSDVNPNTPVTDQAATTSVSSGETASFDDLESLFLNPEHKVRGAKKAKAESAEPKSEEKKEEKKPLTNTTEKKPDAKASETEKKPTKSEGKKEERKDVEADQASAKAAPAKRTFKGKHQDKDLEIDEDTQFYVKVNGQEMPVAAKDLFGNYSGKVAWDKKFNEVNAKELGLRKEKNQFSGLMNQAKSMFEEKDPTIRLFKMAQLAGVEAPAFRKQFFDEMSKELETYLTMTDDQKKARDLEFENSYLKYKADASQKTLADQQAQADLDKKVKGLLEKSKIGEDAFHSRAEALQENLSEDLKKRFLQEGKLLPNGQPSPEFIVETIEKDHLWDATASAFEGVKHSWKTPELNQKILELVEDAHRAGMRPSDMAEIVSEVYGSGKSKRVIERVEKEREEHYSGKRDVSTNYSSSSNSPQFFDEL